MGNSPSSEWFKTFNYIKENHDKAYRVIEEAISLEEQEKPNEAIDKYKEGVDLIDKALSIRVSMPETADFRWEQACRMIQKMKRTRGEVLTRIHAIHSSPGFIQHEPPPSYDDTVETSSNIPQTYAQLASELRKITDKLMSSKVDVIYLHDNVKLYFISPDGTVTQTSEPQTLVIGTVAEADEGTSKAFLQVGAWIYPLVPGLSPCYRTDYGAFILPDITSGIQGSSVGLILPEEADSSVYELLESILHGIIGQTPTLQKIKRDISERISEKLISGATYLSENLIKGAQKASDYLNQKTPEIIEKIQPAEQPAQISNNIGKTLEVAHTASSRAATITGYLVHKVGTATQAVGQYLAPHIDKQGTKLLKYGFNMSEEEARSKINSVLTVAVGAIEGFSTVIRGLETSASILGKNLSTNTVKVVEYKYGAPAGKLASNTLGLGGNACSIYFQAKHLTPKGIVRKTAKETSKAVIVDKESKPSTSGATTTSTVVTSADLPSVYPDLRYLHEMEQSAPSIALVNRTNSSSSSLTSNCK